MHPELKQEFVCKCCGGKVVWCDSLPDEDGDTHECNVLACVNCPMSYTVVNSEQARKLGEELTGKHEDVFDFFELKLIAQAVYEGACRVQH